MRRPLPFARSSSPGDESDPVGAAQAVAGADSSVSVTYGSEAVSVTVSCPVIPDPLGVLPTVVTG